MSEHKQGCSALGGYGHGVGPCDCGAMTPDVKLLAEARKLADAIIDADGRLDTLKSLAWPDAVMLAKALRASPGTGAKGKRIKLDDYSCLELTDYPNPYGNRTELHWWLKRDDSYIRPLNEFEELFVNCALTRSGREA